MSNNHVLATKVQLSVSVEGLVRKLELLSTTDPFVVIYISPPGANKKWVEYFRTNTIYNSHSPEFPDFIIMDYQFESMQPLRFEVYDRKNKSDKLDQQDLVGVFETKLSAIMGRRENMLAGELQPPDHRNVQKSKRWAGKLGVIKIRPTVVKENKDQINFHFKGINLDRKNLFGFGKSDPFFMIKRKSTDGSNAWVKVFESEFIKSELNPVWKQQKITAQQLCDGDYTVPLKIEVYDWQGNGKHQLIGIHETDVAALRKAKETENIQLDLINPKLKAKRGIKYANSGILEVANFFIEERFSFLEYIRGGCELNLVVAIDFTGSNGDPTTKTSLHYNPERHEPTDKRLNETPDARQLNDYQKAIIAVGQILEDYDTDKMFPTFGFGANVNGVTSHCFALNFKDNPEVPGIDGILDAYDLALNVVKLSGPTYFSEVIQTAAALANNYQTGEQKYTTLLILTDGCINDMRETTKAIVDSAADTPLSIIIVGVGNADFGLMDELDGDDIPLRSFSGRLTPRDIVQFVPFNKFSNMGFGSLAEEVLAEIPEQLESFFASKRIKPLIDGGNEQTLRQYEVLRSASVRHFEPPVAPLAISIPMIDDDLDEGGEAL